MKKWFCLALLLSGCAGADRGEELLPLASALTKLSAAVEAQVRYGQAPADLDDQALLALATGHDPGLLAPFAGYELRVRRDNGHGLVLVCDDGRALLEDAGCTGPLDAQRWHQASACDFSLELAAICR
ncbi:hypothetical protein [Gallaecimonas sp. GXIMD4217]|uniref:hypothetical protein n=1 Tax=Gallaecimonas sp. GXIMD4217 TaxID=3131927 RepID=UPI00311AD044